MIAARTGRELGGNAGYLPIHSRGFSVVSSGLVVTCPPPHALSELRADALAAHFSLLELWRGKFRIDWLSARHLQAGYGAAAARLLNRAEFPPPIMMPPAQDESATSVDIRKVTADRTDLFWGDPAENGGQIRDVASVFYPDGKNLRVHGNGGTFQQAKWPQTRVNGFKLYYAKPALRIEQGQLALGEHGRIDVSGDLKFEKSASMDLQLKFTQCPIPPLVSGEGANKIDGAFVADAHLQKEVGEGNSISAAGHVSLEKAIVKNVPALEQAASFTGKAQLSPLHINEAHANYRWADNKLVVREFKAEATHLLCLRGDFTYAAGEIDGTFQLGVAPDIAAKFPGAREDVFTQEEDGYLWTKVILSGPLAHPRNDLKPRLMTALQKHFVGGILEPVFKPAQNARGVINLLFPQ
jgi:hypothetical protein